MPCSDTFGDAAGGVIGVEETFTDLHPSLVLVEQADVRERSTRSHRRAGAMTGSQNYRYYGFSLPLHGLPRKR